MDSFRHRFFRRSGRYRKADCHERRIRDSNWRGQRRVCHSGNYRAKQIAPAARRTGSEVIQPCLTILLLLNKLLPDSITRRITRNAGPEAAGQFLTERQFEDAAAEGQLLPAKKMEKL